MSGDLSAYLVGLASMFWIVGWLVGPARILFVGIMENATVNFPHLNARKRRERAEIWLILPFIAFLLSWLSGLGVSWWMSDTYSDGFLAVCSLYAGIAIIYSTGIFIGLRDVSAHELIRQITDPKAYLVELKSRAVDGVLGIADMKEAEAHLAKLEFKSEPGWRKGIREVIAREHNELGSARKPIWKGVGIWRDEHGKRIRITAWMIWRAGWRDLTLWASFILSFMPALFLFAGALWGPWTVPSWENVITALLTVSIGLLAVTFTTACIGVRAYLISGIRLNIAERQHKEEIETLIADSHEAHRAPAIRELAQVPSRTVPLFREILEVLHRRYC